MTIYLEWKGYQVLITTAAAIKTQGLKGHYFGWHSTMIFISYVFKFPIFNCVYLLASSKSIMLISRFGLLGFQTIVSDNSAFLPCKKNAY